MAGETTHPPRSILSFRVEGPDENTKRYPRQDDLGWTVPGSSHSQHRDGGDDGEEKDEQYPSDCLVI